MNDLLEKLNAAQYEERLGALREIVKKQSEKLPPFSEEVNNHVHTIYSFSPYSPTKAAYMARKAGLGAVGIMDHDSVSGAHEMIEACKILRIASTVGYEIRVNFTNTEVEGKTLNHPDSPNIGYIAIHGIPKQRIEDAKRYLEPIHEARNDRNKKQVEKLNELITSYDIGTIDFEKDVKGISQAVEGGSVTERHILYALGKKLENRFGKGQTLLSFLEVTLGVKLSKKQRSFLANKENPFYLYDLLGVLKSSFIEKIYVHPHHSECPNVEKMVAFANDIHAIPAYAYLGDVTESPTGDKKAQKFEDDYLDTLLPELKRLGFKAITYMPPRNTKQQLRRIQTLCKEFELMQISGVDINSPRQSFNCPEVLEPESKHLIDATWALIAHEKLASSNETYALWSKENPWAKQNMDTRIQKYTEVGKHIDHRHPEDIEFFRQGLNCSK